MASRIVLCIRPGQDSVLPRRALAKHVDRAREDVCGRYEGPDPSPLVSDGAILARRKVAMEQAQRPTVNAGEKRKWEGAETCDGAAKEVKTDAEERPEKQRIVGKDGKVLICELSKNRRISVGQYAGKKLVDIREYYEKNGDMLPGKKGISLTVDQFQMFKEHIAEIEDELYNDRS